MKATTASTIPATKKTMPNIVKALFRSISSLLVIFHEPHQSTLDVARFVSELPTVDFSLNFQLLNSF
jgi:hypothetical protein